MILLHLLFITTTLPCITHSWTILFDTQACVDGFATDTESQNTAFIGKNSTCGPNGISVLSCDEPTVGVGGPFIYDLSNINISIEINFTMNRHPVPNITTLFSVADYTTSSDFDNERAYYGGLSLVMFNNYVPADPDLLDGWVASHFFAFYSPSILSRTGYCDTLSATTQLLFFNDATFQELMQEMRMGSTDAFIVRAMFVKQEGPPLFYVVLQSGGREGIAFSPTNIDFTDVSSDGHRLGNQTAFYFGCGPYIPNSEPGVTIRSVKITQNFDTPIVVV